jgi:hypothetical protein
MRRLFDKIHGAIEIVNMIQNPVGKYHIDPLADMFVVFDLGSHNPYPGSNSVNEFVEAQVVIEQGIELLVEGQEEARPNNV